MNSHEYATKLQNTVDHLLSRPEVELDFGLEGLEQDRRTLESLNP